MAVSPQTAHYNSCKNFPVAEENDEKLEVSQILNSLKHSAAPCVLEHQQSKSKTQTAELDPRNSMNYSNTTNNNIPRVVVNRNSGVPASSGEINRSYQRFKVLPIQGRPIQAKTHLVQKQQTSQPGFNTNNRFPQQQPTEVIFFGGRGGRRTVKVHNEANYGNSENLQTINKNAPTDSGGVTIINYKQQQQQNRPHEDRAVANGNTFQRTAMNTNPNHVRNIQGNMVNFGGSNQSMNSQKRGTGNRRNSSPTSPCRMMMDNARRCNQQQQQQQQVQANPLSNNSLVDNGHSRNLPVIVLKNHHQGSFGANQQYVGQFLGKPMQDMSSTTSKFRHPTQARSTEVLAIPTMGSQQLQNNPGFSRVIPKRDDEAQVVTPLMMSSTSNKGSSISSMMMSHEMDEYNTKRKPIEHAKTFINKEQAIEAGMMVSPYSDFDGMYGSVRFDPAREELEALSNIDVPVNKRDFIKSHMMGNNALGSRRSGWA